MPLLVRLRSESVDCQAQILTSPVEAETRRSQKIPLQCLFEIQQKHLYVYRTEQINSKSGTNVWCCKRKHEESTLISSNGERTISRYNWQPILCR